MSDKSYSEELNDQEIDYKDEDTETIKADVSNYDIAVFYNTYNLSVLLDEIEEETLIVPHYQRSFVWDQKRASEFIDSILRKLPVPAFFLYDDIENNKRLIVDGQQRLKSLYFFIKKGEFNNKIFNLTGNVHKDWEHKTYMQLSDDHKKRLLRVLLNCTVMRQVTPDDDHSSMYLVFHRINTGGIALKAQEIRMSMSYGQLSEWLMETSEAQTFDKWPFLRLKREIDQKNYHRIQELIVRVMALYLEGDQYTGNMRKFIDDFFARNRNFKKSKSEKVKSYSEEELKEIFSCVLDSLATVESEIFAPASKPTIAFFEAVWLGLICRKLVLKRDINNKTLSNYIASWKSSGDEKYQQTFKDAFHARRTSSKESVLLRLKLAKEYFSKDF